MKTVYLLLIALFSGLLLAGCQQDKFSSRGFSLPPGDEHVGKQVFIKYQCLACHTLKGVEDNQLTAQLSEPVALGGQVARIKTYAELVTSIINPSHRLARGYPLQDISFDGTSKMPGYNDIMTVTELINLVAFLQERYKLVPYQYTHYNQYYPAAP